MTDLREPWERGPDESDEAWEAFRYYRDLGPGKRSVRDTAKYVGKNRNLIGGWSTRYKWVHRCDQYDADYDRRHRERREAERARQEATLMDGSEKMIAMALEAMTELVEDRAWTSTCMACGWSESNPDLGLLGAAWDEHSEESGHKRRKTFEPVKLKPTDVVRFLDTGAKVGRLAVGEPTSISGKPERLEDVLSDILGRNEGRTRVGQG